MDRAKLLKMYEDMLRIRLFVDEECRQNLRGKIPGYLHAYTGEEAVAVGVCSNLTPKDAVFSNHRAEGHLIAMGASFKGIMAEVFGKSDGYVRGLGGPMHISIPSLGVIHSNGVVGGGIGLAVGAGLAFAYRSEPHVAVCFFGDGASNQGVLHEAMNLASIWKLPVIFVCENNGYAISTPAREAIAIERIADRAAGYRMPGYTVDGSDVLAVDEVAAEAIQAARQGQGPSFIECKVNRWRGHNEGDPQYYYRTREEVRSYRESCPIDRLRRMLLEEGLLTQAEDEALIERIKLEVQESVDWAEASPVPSIEEVLRCVWEDNS